MLVGGIALTPAVALAVPTNVRINSINTTVNSGEPINIEYVVAVANVGGGQQNDDEVVVELQAPGLRCTGDCGRSFAPENGERRFTAQVTAPTLNPGANQTVTIRIIATSGQDAPSSATRNVQVQGPQAAPTVQQVSGKVRDQNGKAVSGASVGMKDAAGNPFETTSNGSGGYSFNASGDRVIAPGKITVLAAKKGYDPVTVDVQAAAGRSVNVNLTLKLVAATPSATPSASATAEASDAATDPATDEQTQEQVPPATDNASNESEGSGSLLFIILGGLLVAAGVGAIVLVMMRRKNAAEDDGFGDDPTALAGGVGMVPPSQGRFNDATRVGAPMGAGRDASATMVTSRPGGISDAPTMMHRPVPADDEFPDPYGVPIPQQGGYRDGYGNQYGGSGYGEQPQHGYGGAPAGGYSDQRPYDEPTGLYQPAADPDPAYDRGRGYDAGGSAGGGAGSAAYRNGGYDQGYDEGRDGYGPRSGAAYSSGEYGGQQYDDGRGGYGEPGGYDDQRGGSQSRAGGYGSEQPGGYEQGGYGAQQPRPEASRPGQRRSVDWMDD